MISATEVEEILEDIGVDATLKTYPAATFNPSTNKSTDGTATEVSVKAIPPYQNVQGYGRPDLIATGKGKSGISGLVTPKVGDYLTFGSVVWRITGVTTVQTNLGTALHVLEIEN